MYGDIEELFGGEWEDVEPGYEDPFEDFEFAQERVMFNAPSTNTLYHDLLGLDTTSLRFKDLVGSHTLRELMEVRDIANQRFSYFSGRPRSFLTFDQIDETKNAEKLKTVLNYYYENPSRYEAIREPYRERENAKRKRVADAEEEFERQIRPRRQVPIILPNNEEDFVNPARVREERIRRQHRESYARRTEAARSSSNLAREKRLKKANRQEKRLRRGVKFFKRLEREEKIMKQTRRIEKDARRMKRDNRKLRHSLQSELDVERTNASRLNAIQRFREKRRLHNEALSVADSTQQLERIQLRGGTDYQSMLGLQSYHDIMGFTGIVYMKISGQDLISSVVRASREQRMELYVPFASSLLSVNLNIASDATYSERNNAAMIHATIAVPKTYFDSYVYGPEMPGNEAIMFTAQYAQMTVARRQFGEFSFTFNPDSHDLFASQNFMHCIIHIARRFLLTGALAGLSAVQMSTCFQSFIVQFGMRKGTQGNMRFIRIVLGPFNVSQILTVVKAELERLIQQMYDQWEIKILEMRNVNSGGNEDLLGFGFEHIFDGTALPTDENLREMAVRRLEIISFKFLPHAPRIPEKYKHFIRKPPHQQPPPSLFTTEVNTTGSVQLVRPTFEEMNEQLEEAADIIDDSEDEGKEPISGGCYWTSVKREDRLECSVTRFSGLFCPTNIGDNDCAIICLMKASERDNLKAITIRRLVLGHPDLCERQDLEKLANFFQCRIYVYRIIRITGEERFASGISKIFRMVEHIDRSTKTKPAPLFIAHLLCHQDHYFLITRPEFVVKKVKCATCTQWIRICTFRSHRQSCCYCVACKRPFKDWKDHADQCRGPSDYLKRMQTRLNRRLILDRPSNELEWRAMKNVNPSKRMSSWNRIWGADIEAFADASRFDDFSAYAIRLSNIGTHETHVFFGPTAMPDFLEKLKEVNGTLIYFNGSGFDNYLHLHTAIALGYQVDPRSFIINAGRIIAFNQHPKLKVHDLYLFIQSSLEDACQNWGVPQDISKRKFDHSKIYDWESAERHREEVLEYLKYDVLSLCELYRIFSKCMFDCFGVDINHAVTPSHYAVQCWASMCPMIEEIYIPHAGKEMDDDRAAYRGGRVSCQRREFISSQWDQLDSLSYEEITSFLVQPDVNSLYPSEQVANDYAYGKWEYIFFPNADSEEHHDMLRLIHCEMSKDVMTRTCFKVDVICPRDLITPFLLSRDDKGKLVHDLLDKKNEWYWGCEVMEAVILGYRFVRCHEIKRFEKSGDLFSKYVNLCWQGRKDNPAPSVKNICFKYAMNRLTGKFGQNVSETNTFLYSLAVNNNAQRKNIGTQEQFEKMMDRVVNFTNIYDRQGMFLAHC